MAQYNSYVRVQHSTYDQFRNATIGNGYNVDRAWGNQCWDYVALLYYQYGLTLITKPGGGSAYQCWTISRNINSRSPFTSIDGVTNIRRGDVIVTNRNPWSSNGHIFIADENYRTSGNRGKIWGIGQNQRGSSALPVTRDEISLTYFLGIFRNTSWSSSPTPPPTPTPTPTPSGENVYNNSKYPWVLYNFNKNKGKRNGQRNLWNENTRVRKP